MIRRPPRPPLFPYRRSSDLLPERVARKKLVAELLDRGMKLGFLNLGHLRDAVSRNGLKLRDLGGVGELVRGDPLLRADARLRSEEHTSELQSLRHLVCRLLL